jgi:hypothetical protein
LTFLTDPEERKKQYIDSIIFFISKSPFRKIVVCDNSNYSYPQSLCDLARSHNKELELISFSGNALLVTKYGKGFGEGEILEYVLLNSVLIKQVDAFFKITGRLKLINALELLRQMDEHENYFMPISLLRPQFMMPEAARRCVDVRVYYTTKAFFKEYLLLVYKDVRDKDIFFLEHVYHKAMENVASKVSRFPLAPEIIGMSGSNGWMFKERTWLQKALTRLVNSFGYIHPIYQQKSRKEK